MKQRRELPETIERQVFAVGEIKITCSFDDAADGQMFEMEFALFDDLDRAQAYESAGRHIEAIEIFEKRLRAKPYDFVTALDLARCHLKINDLASAESYFRRAISSPLLTIVSPAVCLSYATLLQKLEKNEEAFVQLSLAFDEQKRRGDFAAEKTYVLLENLAPKLGISPTELETSIKSAVNAR